MYLYFPDTPCIFERHTAPDAYQLADLAASAEPAAKLSPVFVLQTVAIVSISL
jgi:hypothetical protein